MYFVLRQLDQRNRLIGATLNHTKRVPEPKTKPPVSPKNNKIQDVHRKNSDILIRVQNVLKKRTKFLKMKMFLLCLNQDEKLFSKLNLSFIFSQFPSNIEIIDTKMYIDGF